MPYQNFNKNKGKFPWLGQVVLTDSEGKRIQKRKQCRTKKEALLWEAEERARLKTVAIQPEKIRTVSLLGWATAYLEYSEEQFVKSTFEEKRFAFKQLFRHPGVNPSQSASELFPKVVLEHLQNQAKERSGNGANKDRKNLRAAWQWGRVYLGLPKDNPFDSVQRFAESRNERAVPTMEDFWKVFDVAPNDQDQLMLLALLHTGARRDELFRLRWEDVDFIGKRIRLHTRKNEIGEWKAAWLPMSCDLQEKLKEHQKITGMLSFVFLNRHESDDPQQWVPYLYRQHWLKKLCAKAGVKQFGFHGVRHLFASILASHNRPLVEIQQMLRHGSITTTARYIHALDSGNRDALSVLPGLEDREKN